MVWTDPFAVLDIPHGSSETEIKIAYRKALLAYHPDKNQSGQTKYTVDDVNEAYKQIKLSDSPEANSDNTPINFNEVVDLSECTEVELPNGTYQWSKGCRCGDEQGYVLFERDLELNGDADEIAVQCAGCSIWILVQYDSE